MTKHGLGVSFLLSSTLLLACGGSKPAPKGGTDAGAQSSATSAEFCASLLQVAQAFAARCAGGNPSLWADAYAKAFDCRRLAREIASGQFAYDASRGAQCLAQIGSAACDGSGEITACETALLGLVPSGGSCPRLWVMAFSPCAPGNYCGTEPDTCGGICKPDPQPGSPCATTSNASVVGCARGSSCQISGRLCMPDVGEGEPCEGPTGGECAAGLYCEGGSFDAVGMCRKRRASGACTDDRECVDYYTCLLGDNPRTCQRTKMPGEPCTPGRRECTYYLSWCGSDNRCTATLLQENEACNAIGGEYDRCDVGLICVHSYATGKDSCQKLLPAGSPCRNDGECTGSYAYCDSTTKLCVSCE